MNIYQVLLCLVGLGIITLIAGVCNCEARQPETRVLGRRELYESTD
jgi:hypothetical protein